MFRALGLRVSGFGMFLLGCFFYKDFRVFGFGAAKGIGPQEAARKLLNFWQAPCLGFRV